MLQDKMLLANQYDMEKEMKKYNLMHVMDDGKNYANMIHSYSKDVKQELAEYIHTNYNSMDETEMKTIALKCLDMNEIKKILLSFELKNYKHKHLSQKMSLNEFTNEAMILFKRYQSKAGGFLLEDSEWIVYDNTTTKYEVSENELLFENTINTCDIDDDETTRYLDYIVKRLNSFAKNIYVEWRQKRNNHSRVMSLLIWITDKDKNISKTVIGL